jgi:hypothetical protein
MVKELAKRLVMKWQNWLNYRQGDSKDHTLSSKWIYKNPSWMLETWYYEFKYNQYCKHTEYTLEHRKIHKDICFILNV